MQKNIVILNEGLARDGRDFTHLKVAVCCGNIGIRVGGTELTHSGTVWRHLKFDRLEKIPKGERGKEGEEDSKGINGKESARRREPRRRTEKRCDQKS